MMSRPTRQVRAVWPILSRRPQQQSLPTVAVVAAAESALARGLRTVSPHSPHRSLLTRGSRTSPRAYPVRSPSLMLPGPLSQGPAVV